MYFLGREAVLELQSMQMMLLSDFKLKLKT